MKVSIALASACAALATAQPVSDNIKRQLDQFLGGLTGGAGGQQGANPLAGLLGGEIYLVSPCTGMLTFGQALVVLLVVVRRVQIP